MLTEDDLLARFDKLREELPGQLRDRSFRELGELSDVERRDIRRDYGITVWGAIKAILLLWELWQALKERRAAADHANPDAHDAPPAAEPSSYRPACEP